MIRVFPEEIFHIRRRREVEGDLAAVEAGKAALQRQHSELQWQLVPLADRIKVGGGKL